MNCKRRKVCNLEPGFVKANSTNLPAVTMFMAAEYFANNAKYVAAEIRNYKTSRSLVTNDYNDDAVGFVQTKSETTSNNTIVKAQLTPEQSVNASTYEVRAIVDTQQQQILSVDCESCKAAKGGCKHAVALIGWLANRWNEPSCTSIKCYWKRSALATINLDMSYVSGDEESDHSDDVGTADIVTDYVAVLKNKKGCDKVTFLRHYDWDTFTSDEENISLHSLMVKFKIVLKKRTFEDYLEFCNQQMLTKLCQSIEKNTRTQGKCKLWHTIRYARVTASKAHEVAHCHTAEGSLLEILFGAAPILNTAAMKRGTRLEPQVRDVLSNILGQKIRNCGILVKSSDPIFGASPDGIATDGTFIIEIKCPSKQTTFSNYIGKNNKIGNTFYAQMQLQMYLADVHTSIFCVADPNFNVDVATTDPFYNKKVNIINVSYDNTFTFELLDKCKLYWKNNVFPKLFNSVSDE